MKKKRTFIAIDLKSFFASVECVERGLDPLRTNLVVADITRTEKTICLAVTPSLKAYGIGGRARLFEVVQRVHEVNMERLCFSPDGIFHGRSVNDDELQHDMSLELDYIAAPPSMSRYIEYSKRIFQIYLRYVAPEDIYAYSIDEVFADITDYLKIRKQTPREMVTMMIADVFRETGITATAGIGTNLYLCKVAMDIVAKHTVPDANGVRIAELDEHGFRHQLWNHRPLTDFWQVGRATSHKLEANGMMTMGDVARRSLTDENLLYKLFGVNAEILIDHAWGWEPVRLEDIAKTRPQNSSLSSGQVLKEPYTAAKARVVVREMADSMSLRLTRKGVVAAQLMLFISYDISNLDSGNSQVRVGQDYYGRAVPMPAHGSIDLPQPTDSSRIISAAAVNLFDSIVDSSLLVRRLNLAAAGVVAKSEATMSADVQLGLFDDPAEVERAQMQTRQSQERDARLQKATLTIKERFGYNSILHGANFEEGATGRERNGQLGGHKA